MLKKLIVSFVSAHFMLSSPILYLVVANLCWLTWLKHWFFCLPCCTQGERYVSSLVPSPWSLDQSAASHGKKLLTVLSMSPLNREPRHGDTLCSTSPWACSCSPHNFDTACFMCFSDRELNELDANLKAWLCLVEAGPFSSLKASMMSMVRSLSSVQPAVDAI